MAAVREMVHESGCRVIVMDDCYAGIDDAELARRREIMQRAMDVSWLNILTKGNVRGTEDHGETKAAAGGGAGGV